MSGPGRGSVPALEGVPGTAVAAVVAATASVPSDLAVASPLLVAGSTEPECVPHPVSKAHVRSVAPAAQPKYQTRTERSPSRKRVTKGRSARHVQRGTS